VVQVRPPQVPFGGKSWVGRLGAEGKNGFAFLFWLGLEPIYLMFGCFSGAAGKSLIHTCTIKRDSLLWGWIQYL